jgi:benzodiazapine receptor
VTANAASGWFAGGFCTAPVTTSNLDPWHGHIPLAAMVQPWWVQIAECPTTEPPDAASTTGPSGPSAITAPAASMSATEANGLPVGAAAVGSAALVGAASVLAAAEVAALFAVGDASAAVVPVAALVAAVVVVAVVLELQAAAAASTAVPDAARTVRRGRTRGVGVMAVILQGDATGTATGRRWGFVPDTRRRMLPSFDPAADFTNSSSGGVVRAVDSTRRRAAGGSMRSIRPAGTVVTMNKLLILAGCVAGVTATAVAGGLATDPDSTYYRTLDKPDWQPPPPVYGIVWTPLYADIALATGHAISTLGDQGKPAERRSLFAALAVNLALNAGWSWLFFRGHRPWVAAAECAVLTASSADLVRRVGAADRRAGIALAPYPLWTGFATVLTAAIARRNPRAAILSRLRG